MQDMCDFQINFYEIYINRKARCFTEIRKKKRGKGLLFSKIGLLNFELTRDSK
jgi:hypothetical protein